MEHDQHVRTVLEQLRTHGLYAKLEKCSFDKDNVEFLGYIVSPKEVNMDPTKVETILSWAIPKSIHDVQSFLGFGNFYRLFIKNFSNITAPMTVLTHKDKGPFKWNLHAQGSFDTLKAAFTSAPVLAYVNPS